MHRIRKAFSIARGFTSHTQNEEMLIKGSGGFWYASHSPDDPVHPFRIARGFPSRTQKEGVLIKGSGPLGGQLHMSVSRCLKAYAISNNDLIKASKHCKHL